MDATVRGSLIEKGKEAIMELLEEMATNIYPWLSKHNIPNNTLRVSELDILTALSS